MSKPTVVQVENTTKGFEDQFTPYSIDGDLPIKASTVTPTCFVLPRSRGTNKEAFYPNDSVSKRRKYWCVYVIVFCGTDQFYIGSTMHWPKRAQVHFKELETRRHVNKRLENLYHEQGHLGAFIQPIEEIDPSMGTDFLLRREEFWIKVTRAATSSLGLNICDSPTKGTMGTKRTTEQRRKISQGLKAFYSNPANAQKVFEIVEAAKKRRNFQPKQFILYSPTGEQTHITNLRQFCRDNDLNYDSIHSVIRGKLNESRGWSLYPEKRKTREPIKAFRLKDGEGTIHEASNMKQFSLKHDLSYTALKQIVSGKRDQCKGWRLA